MIDTGDSVKVPRYVQGGFWTGPPDLQYQNEKQVAANQD